MSDIGRSGAWLSARAGAALLALALTQPLGCATTSGQAVSATSSARRRHVRHRTLSAEQARDRAISRMPREFPPGPPPAGTRWVGEGRWRAAVPLAWQANAGMTRSPGTEGGWHHEDDQGVRTVGLILSVPGSETLSNLADLFLSPMHVIGVSRWDIHETDDPLGPRGEVLGTADIRVVRSLTFARVLVVGSAAVALACDAIGLDRSAGREACAAYLTTLRFAPPRPPGTAPGAAPGTVPGAAAGSPPVAAPTAPHEQSLGAFRFTTGPDLAARPHGAGELSFVGRRPDGTTIELAARTVDLEVEAEQYLVSYRDWAVQNLNGARVAMRRANVAPGIAADYEIEQSDRQTLSIVGRVLPFGDGEVFAVCAIFTGDLERVRERCSPFIASIAVRRPS